MSKNVAMGDMPRLNKELEEAMRRCILGQEQKIYRLTGINSNMYVALKGLLAHIEVDCQEGCACDDDCPECDRTELKFQAALALAKAEGGEHE